MIRAIFPTNLLDQRNTMEKLIQFVNMHEKKILTVAIYVLFVTTLLLPILSEFFSTIKAHKNDALLAMLVSSITIVFRFIRNIDWKAATISPMLYHYTSSSADMSEIEEQLERYRECDLIVVGNTLTTMWNSLLKRYFNKVHNGEVVSSLNVTFVKYVDDISVFDPEKDPVIPQIESWYKKTKSAISLKIYITDQKISFTGICANKEFLKFRFIGSTRSREVFGRAYRGNDEIQNRIIEWFCFSVNEIISKGRLLISLPSKD